MSSDERLLRLYMLLPNLLVIIKESVNKPIQCGKQRIKQWSPIRDERHRYIQFNKLQSQYVTSKLLTKRKWTV